MKFRFPMLLIFAGLILWASTLWAQDLGPGFTKVKDGIYVYAAKDGNSTCSIVLTEEGPVIIDTCQTPPDGHKLLAAVKKLTDKPIRFVIDTEVHSDHTFDHFIFSPPGIVIKPARPSSPMEPGPCARPASAALSPPRFTLATRVGKPWARAPATLRPTELSSARSACWAV